MKPVNIFKFIVIILITCFIFLLVASRSGYYEYELNEKKHLTDQAIERFESDVKNGKAIDINDYVSSTTVSYNNKISDIGNDFSKSVEKILSKGFSYLIDYLNKESKK